MSFYKHFIKTMAHRRTKLYLTILLLALLITWIDLGEFYRVIVTADYTFLGYATIIILLNRLLMPFKWGLLLRGVGIIVPWWLTIKSYFISNFMGVFLPPTIGADAVRTYYITKQKYRLPDIVASILVERAIGLIVLLLFAGLGCLLFTQHLEVFEFDLLSILWVSLSLLVALVTGLLISLNPRVTGFVTNLLRKPRKTAAIAKTAAKLEALFQAYVKFRDAKLHMLIFALLTCLETMLPILRSYIVGLALGVDLPISYYFAFQPIVILLTRLPISIDGFGINEGLFAYFLGLMGVSMTLGFSIGLVNHILFLLVISFGGILYAFDKQPTVTAKTYNG